MGEIESVRGIEDNKKVKEEKKASESDTDQERSVGYGGFKIEGTDSKEEDYETQEDELEESEANKENYNQRMVQEVEGLRIEKRESAQKGRMTKKRRQGNNREKRGSSLARIEG